MQVGAGAPPGRSDAGDDVALLDVLSGAHFDGVEMAEDGDEAVGVVDDHHVAEPPPRRALPQRITAGEADYAVRGGVHRRADRRGEIEALVRLRGAGEGGAAHAGGGGPD